SRLPVRGSPLIPTPSPPRPSTQARRPPRYWRSGASAATMSPRCSPPEYSSDRSSREGPTMPIPEQRDLEATRDILAGWLAGNLGVDRVEVGPIQGPALTGFSNETLLFDATYTRRGRQVTEGFVVRVKPTLHTVFLESDFEWQYQVLDLLGSKTDVPVPVVRGFEDDPSFLGAPFFLMERLDGCRVPADSPPYTVAGWIHDDATPEQRRTLVESGLDNLVKIHALDWRALGLDF